METTTLQNVFVVVLLYTWMIIIYMERIWYKTLRLVPATKRILVVVMFAEKRCSSSFNCISWFFFLLLFNVLVTRLDLFNLALYTFYFVHGYHRRQIHWTHQHMAKSWFYKPKHVTRFIFAVYVFSLFACRSVVLFRLNVCCVVDYVFLSALSRDQHWMELAQLSTKQTLCKIVLRCRCCRALSTKIQRSNLMKKETFIWFHIWTNSLLNLQC